jgi:hypothetical protein
MRMSLAFLSVLVLSAQTLPSPGVGNQVHGGGPTFDVGFEFRSTSGYVTTRPGDVFFGSTTYAASPGYGWYPGSIDANFVSLGGGSLTMFDRDSGVDARLAGMAYFVGSSNVPFGVLLPSAGTYHIYLAVGDAIGARGVSGALWYDGSVNSPNTIFSGVSTGTAQWEDGSGTLRTSASDWVTNGSVASTTITMATRYLTINFTAATAGDTGVSYLRVTN